MALVLEHLYSHCCSLDGCPHFVVPCPLPLVLTVLLVVSTAFSLCVVLCLIPVLLAAHLFILCLVHSVALLDLHSLALLCLCLHILCVPHLCILCPAGDLRTTLYWCWLSCWLGNSSTILGGTLGHT